MLKKASIIFKNKFGKQKLKILTDEEKCIKYIKSKKIQLISKIKTGNCKYV